MTDKQIIKYSAIGSGKTTNLLKFQKQQLIDLLQAKDKECEELRDAMHKDFCTHYVLGECSQEHHNNCVGRNQCIKDLEQENKELKVYKSITPLKTKMLVKALTEIKEIAETCNSGVSCSACPYTKECRTDLEAQALGVCKMVLKKCEVLNDN